jgi:hypothetical protein
MGVPTKIWFFFWSFEVTYPPIYEGSEACRYDPGIMGIMPILVIGALRV